MIRQKTIKLYNVSNVGDNENDLRTENGNFTIED